LDDDGAPYRAGLARALFVDDAGGSPGGKRTHLIDLMESAAACKAVYAGSIPTPASKNYRSIRDLILKVCIGMSS
jgi:hypothetical protein